MTLELTAATKLFMLLCSVGLIAVTVLLVICFVSPFCILHRLLPERARLKYESVNGFYKNKNKKKSIDSSELGEPVELTKLNVIPSHYEYGSPLSPFSSLSPSSGGGSYPHLQVGTGDPVGLSCKSPTPTNVYGHRRLYTVDSSYSSMAPTVSDAGSRPTSPTSTLFDETDSLSSPPSINSSEIPALYGYLTAAFQYKTQENSNIGRLIITVVDARDLPGREYHSSACDPFVKIVLLKTRTRLRRSKSHYMTLSEFQSHTVRRTRSPVYNQSFVVELPVADVKECALKFMVFDRDKYANPTQLGEVLYPLSDLRLKDFTQVSLELQEPKQNNGEVLLGLSYLPTSERLTFNIIRAVNLKYENVATNIDGLRLEARVLLIHNGKLMKKKKTCAVSSTNNPNFDAGLSFDLPSSELHHVVFVVGVAHRGELASESDETTSTVGGGGGSFETLSNASDPSIKPSRHDSYIGKVVLGSVVHTSSAHHWQAMLHCPRQQVTSWHVLR